MTSTKTIRDRQIEAIADLIYEHMTYDVLTDDDPWLIDPDAEARRINETGWTFELSPSYAPGEQQDPNRVIRHEGVVLTDAELDTALAMARRWVEEPSA